MAETPRSPEIRARLADPTTWLWLLGVNAWGALLAVPTLHLRLWASPVLLFLLCLPLLALAFGIQRLSKPWLLLGFPMFLLLPIALQPRLAGANVYVSFTFVLTILSLSSYLLVAAFATRLAGYQRQDVEIRRFPPAEVPTRWRRRLYLLDGLSIGIAVLPILLLALSDGKPRPESGVAKPLSPLLVNGVAFSILLLAVLGYLLQIVNRFFQGESPQLAPPKQKPWQDSAFLWAIVLALISGYLYYRLR
jgi:hypothetical protein